MFHHHLHRYHSRNAANLCASGGGGGGGASGANTQSVGAAAAVYELHSTASFFTSNPILYFSHYSEIIVHSHAGKLQLTSAI